MISSLDRHRELFNQFRSFSSSTFLKSYSRHSVSPVPFPTFLLSLSSSHPGILLPSGSLPHTPKCRPSADSNRKRRLGDTPAIWTNYTRTLPTRNISLSTTNFTILPRRSFPDWVNFTVSSARYGFPVSATKKHTPRASAISGGV